MLTLVQFQPAYGLLNASPFCMKVEVYCRLAKIPYQTEVLMNPGKAPKGKLPFIRHENHIIADSEYILDYLEQLFSVALDDGLSEGQKALARTIRLMCEEHLYWTLLYNHWQDEKIWPQVREVFFSGIPFPLNKLIGSTARKRVIKQLYAAGMGRHTEAEIYASGVADVEALAALLGNNEFMLGATATRVDASVYASLANIVVPPLSSPVKDAIEKHANLMAYVGRMQALIS